MTDANQPRDGAYLALLHLGLVLIRNHAQAGRADLCGIEADHLHNIPTLLGETNEARHRYYIEAERGSYRRQLRDRGDADYLEEVTIWYSEAWRALADAAGVQLPE